MRMILTAVMAALLSAACSEGGNKPVPRRRAYPRVEIPDTVMLQAEGMPLHMPVNAGAVVESPRPGWLDVTYPGLGAQLHITFTGVNSAAELAAVKANRMERLSLNAGERGGDAREYVNDYGFDIYVLRTDGSATPVQFLATDDSAWVVSGVAYFGTHPGSGAVDSLRPMVDAVERDIVKSLDALCHR